MAAVALRSEERIGLGVAVAAHVALVALLLWRPPAADVVTPPDRIEVTISDDVGLTSTSPEPMAEAAPDVAPEIGAPAPVAPAPVAPAPVVEPRPEPPKPIPRVEPKPIPAPKPAPRPTARPIARPIARPSPAPIPSPKAAPRPVPKAAAPTRPTPKAAAQPAARSNTTTATRPPQRAGGTRIGDDFLKGVPGARSTGAARNPPAAAAGPQVQASLLGAVSRELKPHWQAKVPDGADTEKLVSVLRWNLNRDGSLAGKPQLMRQDGITDANRAQAARHAEMAIRAVQLAAPFDLPEEYYDTWKRLTIDFDKRLSR